MYIYIYIFAYTSESVAGITNVGLDGAIEKNHVLFDEICRIHVVATSPELLLMNGLALNRRHKSL